MAEMDILMPTHGDASTSQSHHPQPTGGCPYFRADPGHHSSFPQPPQLHSLPHPLPHPHSIHNSQNHALPGLHSPTSRGGPLGHSHLSPHSQFPHANFDAVHVNGASPWYSAPTPPYPSWPSSGSASLPPHPHSHPHSSHPHPQQPQHSHSHSHPPLPQLPQSRPGPGPGSSAEPSYLAGVGGGAVPLHSAGAPGTGPGPIQPGLLPNSHHFQPHHDPFAVGPGSTYNQYAFRQPPALHHNHRFPAIPPLGQNNSSQSNHPGQQPPQQQPQPQLQQQQQPQHQQNHYQHHQQQHQQQQQPQQPPQPPQQQPQMSVAGDRSLAPQPPAAAPHGIGLPSLNPAPPPPPAAPPVPPPSMSNTSGESSPDAHPPFRQSLYRVTPPPAPANASESSRPSLFGGPEPSRAHPSSTASSDPEGYSGTSPPVPISTERRRDYTARMRLPRGHPSSDYDSDEDHSDMMETESETLSFLEQFSVGNMAFQGRDEEMRIRTQQMIRGQLSNKRVASKKALNQLQSVDISTLDESERSCVICYNEFGVPNPEGINEAPLRLPNCKHVFGDHCIKKWFEESDSCPYCRDKVPSEPVLTSNTRALHQIIQNYANHPRLPSGRSHLNADPAFVRMLAQREEARFEGSPPRAWQTGERTGERRSPPSEASESRRRTRARHSSFRASAATNTSSNRPNSHGGMNPTAPLQQSLARERFMHMPNNHRLYGYPAIGGPAGVGRAPTNIPPEPFGLAPPSMPPTHVSAYGPMLSPVEDQRFQNPLNGGSGPPVPTESAQLPGPAHMTTFSQQLPPLDPPNYQSAPNTANGPSGVAGDVWMQQ